MKFKNLFFIYFMLFFVACYSPESEGKKAAAKFCDCEEEFTEKLSKETQNFIDNFAHYGFETRVEARKKSEELTEKASSEYGNCVQKAQQQYAKLKGKYVGNYEKTAKFEYAYNAKKEFSEQRMMQGIPNQMEINDLILAIIPIKPNLEKMRTDLVGRTITKNGDIYRQVRKFKADSEQQISNVTIIKEEVNGDNYTIDVFLELSNDASVYVAELTVNYFLGRNDDWTIEYIHAKRLETKATGKYNDCIIHSFGNGGFMTQCVSLTNNCDVPLLVEGILMTGYEREWLPFEILVESNNYTLVGQWGDARYVGSVIDYKIQKIERP